LSEPAHAQAAYCWVDATADPRAKNLPASTANPIATLSDAGPPAPAVVDPLNPNRALDPATGRTFVRLPCSNAAAMSASNGYVDDAFEGLANGGAGTPNVGNPATGAFDSNRFEVRGGIFAHGIGSVEKNTFDLNLEFVTPRVLPFGAGQWWSLLIPRFQIGGFLNMSGRTSSAYGGGLWTFPIYDGFFAEIYAGGAINDGSQDGTATRAALGCQGAFNLGPSLGYHFNSSWSLMGTWNHMSNGNRLLGVDCPHNKGINDVGLKASYAF
jgi:lipid A 3-O-deacylase